jgi:hypothetical protein
MMLATEQVDTVTVKYKGRAKNGDLLFEQNTVTVTVPYAGSGTREENTKTFNIKPAAGEVLTADMLGSPYGIRIVKVLDDDRISIKTEPSGGCGMV